MKTKNYLLLLMLLGALPSISQTYGETGYDDGNALNTGYVTWWKITTGPSDSGVFTDIGYYDHITGSSATLVQLAIYDDNGSDHPNVMIAESASTAPVDGAYNIFPLLTNPVLLPSTTYWIAFRGNANNQVGRILTYNAPNNLKYKTVAYTDPWPSSGINSSGTILAYSLYAVGNGQFVVPVEMLRFDGTVDYNQVDLTWETATETNNSGWEIQRSQNGHSWDKIDWMDGADNAQSEKAYHYTDKNPQLGVNFYRLKQVDHDGQFAYSDIVLLRIEDLDKKFYPNPVVDQLYHQGYNKTAYTLYQANGNIVMEGTLENGRPIEVSSLPAGAYNLVFQDGPELVQKKIIKN